MIVTYHGIRTEERSLNTTGYGYGRWRGGGSATTYVNTYHKGTLVIDMYDSKTKQMIFRGTGTDSVSDKPEKNEKKINKVFDKMFDPKKWPPKS